MLLRLALTLACVAAFAAPGNAQEHGDEHAAGHGRYALAVFLGSTQVHGDGEFTVGVEGGINLNDKWSVGAVLERAERDRHSTLYLVGLGWHPLGPELRPQFGVGQKDPAGKHETVYRTGLACELELRDRWFVKPYLAVDFIDNEENEEVYGIYVGRAF